MFQEKIVLRGILRHYWRKGLSATAATEQICQIEGESVLNRTTAHRWFTRFNDGDTSLEDKPRSGRPIELDNDDLLTALEEEPHSSTRELSAATGHSQTTMNRHLNEIGLVNKRPRQDLHELTDAQAERRVEVCQQLLKNPLDDRFWKRIVTCDEKWIFLNNPDKRKQWVYPGQEVAVVKQDRFGQKVMLCVWWNYQGIVHFELLRDGRAVNATLYSQQLDRVHQVLQTRYPGLVNRNQVLLQHDNAPAHRTRLTQSKIQELDCIEVLPHPAYSPDIAPSDYGLFRSMAHFLRGRHFDNFDSVEAGCPEFFASKSQDWYHSQIRMLAQRWVTVIENNGLYFEE
jgi:histone-lysine N-methyltransferase SETMAR